MEKKELTFEQAKEKALRLIEFRAHSEKELRDKLKLKGAKPDDIDKIADFCKEYSFIDDRAYAIGKAQDMARLKKFGKRRIAQELRAHGISDEYIDEALFCADDDEPAADKLLPLVRKRLGNDLEKKNRDRVIRYFIYRGYEFDDIRNCIERILADNGI